MTRVRAHEAGFTLMEMLVCVAIIAIAMVPVMEMQSGVSQRHLRQTTELDNLIARRNALTVVREINPMREPGGARMLGEGREMHWRSTRLTATRRSLRFLGGEGDFDVALYRVDVTIDGPNDPMVVEQVGWKRIGPAPTSTN